MRVYSKLVFFVFISLMLLVCAVHSTQAISLEAADVDGNKAVRITKNLNDLFYIGVRGGLPFNLIITDFDKGAKTYLALSNGKFIEMNEERVILTCNYLVKTHGLVIVIKQDGSVLTRTIQLSPAWHIEDAALVPKEKPDLVKPASGDLALAKIIDEWWLSFVSPPVNTK